VKCRKIDILRMARISASVLLLLLLGQAAGRGGGGGKGAGGRSRTEAAEVVAEAAPAPGVIESSPTQTPQPASREVPAQASGCADGYWCHSSQRCAVRWSDCGGAWDSLASTLQPPRSQTWTPVFVSLAAGFVASSLAGFGLRRRLRGAAALPTPLQGSAED